MTGEPQSPARLTDEQRVTQQVAVTDIATATATALSRSFPSGGRAVFSGARTDFEGHRLNEMLDLVHPAQPGHLLDAGHALRAAHGAIDAAAAELDGHIANVEWEGESGEAFRTWGKNLASHARKLADFAGTAGVQISAAGEGLVSVKSALPPRDHRADPVRVTDIPPMRRVAGNAEYEAAVRVEKDRQEAINQLNRLSSFYTVSQQNLASLEAPVFEVMPGVGVPKPGIGLREGPHPPAMGTTAIHYSAQPGPAFQAAVEQSPVRGQLESAASVHHNREGVSISPILAVNPSVGTELNAATTLPTPATSPVATAHTSSGTAMGSGEMGVPLPVNDSVTSPISGSVHTLTGAERLGNNKQLPAIPARGTGSGSVNRVGHSGSAGREVGSERTSTGGQSPMGRGISGGTPSVGAAGPSGVGPGASGRGSGIVGGRPSTRKADFRASKGTVVGGEGVGRSTSSPDQRGVIGARKSDSVGSARTDGRPFHNPLDVVETPLSRSAGARRIGKGFTNGGSGLIRSRQGQGDSESDEDEMSRDPEHLMEGDRSRQGDAPPTSN